MSGVPPAPPRNQSSQYRTCLGAHKHTQTPRGPKHQADAKGGHLCSQAARTPHASGHKRPPLSSPRGQTKRSSPDPRPSLPKWSAHTKPAKNWATRQTRTSPLTSLLCEKSHSTPPNDRDGTRVTQGTPERKPDGSSIARPTLWQLCGNSPHHRCLRRSPAPRFRRYGAFSSWWRGRESNP